jgi:hypothetical protein
MAFLDVSDDLDEFDRLVDVGKDRLAVLVHHVGPPCEIVAVGLVAGRRREFQNGEVGVDSLSAHTSRID